MPTYYLYRPKNQEISVINTDNYKNFRWWFVMLWMKVFQGWKEIDKEEFEKFMEKFE